MKGIVSIYRYLIQFYKTKSFITYKLVHQKTYNVNGYELKLRQKIRFSSMMKPMIINSSQRNCATYGSDNSF
jgi:hypothetical protein